MKHDFEVIQHILGRDLESINLYPLGDLHKGSPNFYEKGFLKYQKLLDSDPNGFILLVGDILNNGLKTSRSNTYEETMRPREQKEWFYEWLKPRRDKLLGGVNGNHEWRSLLVGDDCPLYDVFCRVQKEDFYRENMAFIKINLGEKSNKKQASYSICLAHGASKSKVATFGYALEGVDILISGHIHAPASDFPARLTFDPYNNVIRETEFINIVVPSFEQGGYGLRNMYAPKSHTKIPIIHLSGKEKDVSITWK